MAKASDRSKATTRTRKGASAGSPEGENDALRVARERLATFCVENPPAKVDEVETKGGKSIRVVEAWGDRSFALRIPEDPEALFDALNGVRLPNRLSAIWHKDTNDLEVIWTAHNLPKHQVELAERKFEFVFKGKRHTCEFGEASPRLMVIAEYLVLLTMSVTDWRNLQPFSQYARIPEDRHSNLGLDKPRSFWIRNVRWNEDYILSLVDNLNFYLTYYDYRSPNILVHEPVGESDKFEQRTRYIRGEFPPQIEADESLESNLLSFWNSAYDEQPMMSFLLYFRIIEYAATHFIDASIKSELKKVLMGPDLRANVASSIERIVGAVNVLKLEDASRFKAVLRQSVDPALLWRDVKANLAFFSRETKFDGGFAVRALVSGDDSEKTFASRGVDSFAESARKIRNALAHGKDLETAGVITPTTRNIKQLQPWVHLIATAAGEVVLYKDAT